jgi:uncharacterized protein
MPNPDLVLMTPLPIDALWFLGALGLGVGFLSGLLGIGGGLQMVPGLILLAPYLLDGDLVTAQAATGIAAVQALASSSSSSLVHLKNGLMSKRIVLLFGVPSVLGGYGGSYLSASWPTSWILGIMLIALSATFLLGIKKYIQTVFLKKVAEETAFITDWPHIQKHRGLIVLASLVIGGVAGIVGMGGAVFFVPFMNEALKFPVRQAIITATGIVIMTSIGTLIGKAQTGVIPWDVALGVSAVAFVGGALGAMVQSKVKNKHLRVLHLGLILWAIIESIRKLFL